MLTRGSKNFPTSKAISQQLESLYGASMGEGVNKKGEVQLISFFLESVDGALVPQDDDLFGQSLSLLFDVVFNPLADGKFNDEYVAQEKVNLKDYINSIINDKRAYAVDRCLEEMCKNEAFGISECGYIDDVDAITPQALYEQYCHVVSQSPIDIFVAGNFERDKALETLTKLTENLSPRKGDYPKTQVVKTAGEVKYVTQEMNVSQGKLTIGYRTGMEPTDPNYYALIIYNSIFGSGTHSKLFNNVREKLSLAYYASSQIEKTKGIMLVSSGIAFQNYQKAVDEIFAQGEEMKKGNITDKEFESAVMSVTNSLRSYNDSTRMLIEYYHAQSLLGLSTTLDDAILAVLRVTKDDVTRVAANVAPDTVYFLTGQETGGAN